MDAKMTEPAASENLRFPETGGKNTEKKAQIKERGLTVSNLLARAERMYDEVSREVDFHTYNGYAWDPEKPRWGQKKWDSLEDCSADLRKLSALKLRMAEAARKCDRAMRTDIAFDDLCASVEKTTDDLDVVLAEDPPAK